MTVARRRRHPGVTFSAKRRRKCRGIRLAEARGMKIKTLFASCMFLSIAGSSGSALAAGPDVHSSCNGASVPSSLSSAEGLASSAASRLNGLAGKSKAQREALWNAGAERRWFGAYSNTRFNNVRKRMNNIAEALRSSRLDVKCLWSKSYFGNASPGVYVIHLLSEGQAMTKKFVVAR